MTTAQTPAEILELALQAEADRRLSESLALCQQAIGLAPEDAGAINLLGRLCAQAGDGAQAALLHAYALYFDPGSERAEADLADALAGTRGGGDAGAAYAEAVAIEPDVECHHRHALSLAPFATINRVEVLLRNAVRADPRWARAHAALANVQARRGRRVAAIVEYTLAVRLEPQFAAAHLALAGLYESLGDARAAVHEARALALQQFYLAPPAADRAATRVLVLAAPGGTLRNTPLDFLVDYRRTALDVCYILSPLDASTLGEYDAIFCAMDESESSAAAAASAQELLTARRARAFNHPSALPRVRRERLAQTLHGIAGLTTAGAVRVGCDESAFDDVAFPALIRPVDAHRGQGLARVASRAQLREYLAERTDPAYTLTPYIDYRSPDGYFRKYRVVVVDGRPYPYHLAVSNHWLVHYETSPMREHAWMRREEQAFLEKPESVFPAWERLFGEMAAAIGLDYFGVDCTVLADGTVLAFECGGAMLVHDRVRAAAFTYKRRHVRRIREAFEALVEGS